MIPKFEEDFKRDFTTLQMPSKEYGLQIEKAVVNGHVDGLEAMKQVVYKILMTERYEYLIYSWNYGIELRDLFGQPINYAYVEAKARIKEALLADERILDVTDFSMTKDKGTLSIRFLVTSTEGNFESEVDVHV